MDENYYRKQNPSWRKRDGFMRKLWKRRYLRWFIIIILVTLIFSIFSNKGILQRIRLEQEKKFWIEKVDSLQKVQTQLKKELDALEKNNLETIEKVAREKYNFVKKGETIYKLKKKEE